MSNPTTNEGFEDVSAPVDEDVAAAEPTGELDSEHESESEPAPAFETVVAESLAEAAANPAVPTVDGRKPAESWAVELKTPDWQFAAAKMFANWPIGREVTRSEFDKAVTDACNVTCR